LLIDCDFPVANYPLIIQQAYETGAEVVLYSHGAPVITAWDGIWKPGPLTRFYLAQSHGQKWVMETYGYSKPIKVIGWHFCEQREFQPCDDVKNILYAPEHPHSNGYMLAEARELTEKVYKDLLDMPFDVIRHEGPVSLDESIKAIDKTDLVVTYPGTFAALAIARGKPVVMYAQNICPHDGYSDVMLKYVKKWDLYRDFMRYHYDISDTTGSITESIIRRAGIIEETDWRNKFIGEQMKPEILLEALKGL
jgi:hypothetical protein